MNIYQCLEILKKRRTPVYTTSEIARALGTTKSRTNTYVKRMRDRGLLYRVAKGIYTLESDPMIYASYVIPGSYISFNTALYLHKKINQIPAKIQVAVPRRVRKKVEGVEFISLPKRMFFGFRKKEYKGYPIWIAEPEKAVVDILYKFGKVSKDVMKEMDPQKTKSYKKRAGVKTRRRQK